MKHFQWGPASVIAVAAVVAGAQGGEPARRKGVGSASQEAPPLRLEIVARNLWDVLWENQRPRALTGDSRYGWKWLAGRYDRDRDGVVTRGEFPGEPDAFAALDRNWDARLTPEDFDWGDAGVIGRQKATNFALFKAIDKSSDGRISPEEWQAAFARLAKEKGFLDDQELYELIFRPAVQKAQNERRAFGSRRQSRQDRLRQLAESGKLFSDGPGPGEVAPDFDLGTPDGRSRVRLSSYRGHKPVVLIFGSFT